MKYLFPKRPAKKKPDGAHQSRSPTSSAVVSRDGRSQAALFLTSRMSFCRTSAWRVAHTPVPNSSHPNAHGWLELKSPAFLYDYSHLIGMRSVRGRVRSSAALWASYDLCGALLDHAVAPARVMLCKAVRPNPDATSLGHLEPLLLSTLWDNAPSARLLRLIS